MGRLHPYPRVICIFLYLHLYISLSSGAQMQQWVEVSGAIAQFSAIVQPPLYTVGLKMDSPDRAPHPYRTFCKKTVRLSLSFLCFGS